MKKQACGVTRTWIHGCWKCTFIKPTWQTIWQYLLELNIWKTWTLWNSVTQLMLTATKKLHKGVCPVFFHVYGVEKQIKLIPIVRSLGGGLELARKMHKEGFCSTGDTVSYGLRPCVYFIKVLQIGFYYMLFFILYLNKIVRLIRVSICNTVVTDKMFSNNVQCFCCLSL